MRDLGSRGMRRVSTAVGAVALVALAACGGSDSTSPGTTASLDATALGATASRIDAVTTQPVFTAMMSQGAFTGLPAFDHGIARIPQLVARAARLAPSARLTRAAGSSRLAAHATVGGTTLLIPDTLLGKTLVPDAQGTFTMDPSRTGAPPNGVRFVIRTLGTTQDLGFADLTQSVSGATSTLTLDVRTTSGILLMHDVGTTTTSGSDETDTYTGYVTNGTDQIDYTVNLQSTSSRSLSTSMISATSLGVTVADTSVLDGATANDVSVSRVTVGSTVIRMSTPSVADPNFGGYTPSDTSTVTVNGARFATVVINGTGAPTITGPNGAPLSTNDTQALTAAIDILVSMESVLLAPLTVALWLLAVTSGA